ncbi:MAG: hypothetical protein GEV03_24140 [Streptosporangiales bacterium]|nr:hypothetical protein [Streptosporangiales bacterium]
MPTHRATNLPVGVERRPAPPGPLWRVALVWAGLVVVWVATMLLNGYVLEPNLAEKVRHAALAAVTCAVPVGLIIAARRMLERRPLRTLGLSSPGLGARHLLFGAVYWLVLAAVGLGVGIWLGWLDVRVTVPSAAAAVVLQAVLFTAWAFAFVAIAGAFVGETDWGISVDRAVLFLTFGLILGLLRAITGGIWAGVGFHLAFQTVSQLYGSGEAGFLQVQEETANVLNLLSFWLFPVVIGGLLLLFPAMRRRGPAQR